MPRTYKVIYLTGQPAVGKTTLVSKLVATFPRLVVFSYSKLLTEHVSVTRNRRVTHPQLRALSSHVVTPADVRAVDTRLVAAVAKARKHYNVIIDSHPVTQEQYGYRVTPFSGSLLRALSPTMVCMLYATPRLIARRLAEAPEGRTRQSLRGTDLHMRLQAGVSIAYGIEAGVPVYFLDVSRGVGNAARKIASWL